MLKEVCKSLVVLALIGFFPFCLVGCGDDEGGNIEEDIPYQMSDLVGTWEIVHSQYIRRENGVVVDSRSGDVSDEHNRFVFYSDGRVEFLEYSDTQGTWHEDGKGTFYLRNGKIVFMGDFEDVSILSLSKTKLVLKYKFVQDKGDGLIVEKEYIDTMERVDDNGGSADGTYKMSDLVGTWEIVHSQYTCKENGVVVESGSEDVSDEHNRFVFYSNGTFEFLEYDGEEGWHEDGKGTFYLRNGQIVFGGEEEEGLKDFAILSLTKTKLVAKYKFVEDKGENISVDEYIDTMERIAN